MSSLITLGIIKAYLDNKYLLKKIKNGFYEGKVQIKIDNNGFSKLYSSPIIENYKTSLENVPNALFKIEDRIYNSLPSDCYVYYNEFSYLMKNYVKDEAFYLNSAKRDLFCIYYSKEIGRFNFYHAMIEPDLVSKKVITRLLNFNMIMDLPSTFFMGLVAKGNLMSISIKQKLEKMDKSLTNDHIIDAVYVAIAPILLGLVSIPKEFINRLTIIAQAPIYE